MLSITVSNEEFAAVREFFSEKTIVRAAKRAGKEALKAMRAKAKQRIRERVAIRAGYLADKSFPLQQARGVILEDLEWTMLVSGDPVPLGEYPSRQTKKGVSVEVRKGHRSLIPSAFKAMRTKGQKSTREGVFRRPGKERYPMGHRLGLRVSDTFADGQIATVALYRAAERFSEAFGHFLTKK